MLNSFPKHYKKLHFYIVDNCYDAEEARASVFATTKNRIGGVCNIFNSSDYLEDNTHYYNSFSLSEFYQQTNSKELLSCPYYFPYSTIISRALFYIYKSLSRESIIDVIKAINNTSKDLHNACERDLSNDKLYFPLETMKYSEKTSELFEELNTYLSLESIRYSTEDLIDNDANKSQVNYFVNSLSINHYKEDKIGISAINKSTLTSFEINYSTPTPFENDLKDPIHSYLVLTTF